MASVKFHFATQGRTLVVGLMSLWLAACSTLETKPLQTAEIKVTIVDQDRIRFSGKGAGAGMMLMSSMGAMGIAIGVAIDEGIGKDIQEAYCNVPPSFMSSIPT